MERAGFVGMTHKVHSLVKQMPSRKRRGKGTIEAPFGQSGSLETTQEAGASVSGGSRRIDSETLRNLSGYLQSCGGKMEESAEATSPEDLQALIENPESTKISGKDCFGWTMLHHAAEAHPVETVRKLLALRADPNAVNCLGRTPLHLAVMRDQLEIVAELLSYGANPNLGDLDGWTPVHFAVHINSLNSLSALLRYSPDFAAPNLNGKTPKEYVHSETLRCVIHYYEQPKEDSTDASLDSIDTADASLGDAHHTGEVHHCYGEAQGKADGCKRFSLKDRRDAVAIVRAQRPNVESGAIVCPHPNSAYS